MIQKDSANTLFILEGERVVINPKTLMIPEFSDLYSRDKSPGKKRSLKEFAYIYYMADYKSEYNAYGLSKETQLGIDIMMKRDYKPDLYVQKAIDKYKVLQETPSMRYLISMRQRVNSIIDYLDNVEVKDKKRNKRDDGIIDETPINPFITINAIVATMSKLEETIESIEKWEKKVFEEEEEMKIRGGGMLNVFEDPDSAKWLGKK
jgi:hypothetical protein